MFQDCGDYKLIKQCFELQGLSNKMRLFFLLKSSGPKEVDYTKEELDIIIFPIY